VLTRGEEGKGLMVGQDDDDGDDDDGKGSVMLETEMFGYADPRRRSLARCGKHELPRWCGALCGRRGASPSAVGLV
jgi:hypothetical protein